MAKKLSLAQKIRNAAKSANYGVDVGKRGMMRVHKLDLRPASGSRPKPKKGLVPVMSHYRHKPR